MTTFDFILILNAFYTISNGAIYTFTPTVRLDAYPGLVTSGPSTELNCTPNEDCTINCLGVGSCDTSNGLIINGPGAQNALNLNVDSQVAPFTFTQAITFRANLNCKVGSASCSEINIKVDGYGIDTMFASQIRTPDHGVTTFDCRGPAVSGGFVCSQNILFYGTKGFGRAPGQVYVMDVSTTAGRTPVGSGAALGIAYYCTNWQGLVVQDTCHTMMMRWNNQNPKYLECSAKHLYPPYAPLSCQVTLSPTVVTFSNAAPAPKTVSGGPLGGPMGFPLAKGENYAQFDPAENSDDAGYLISEREYYLMRVCESIVVIGCLGMLIKICVSIARYLNQKTHAYAQVKYSTDITTDDDI